LAVVLAPMAVALGLAPTLAWFNYLRPFQKAPWQPLLFPHVWFPCLEHLSLLALVHLALVSPLRAPFAVTLGPMAVALVLAPTLTWLNYRRPFQKAQ